MYRELSKYLERPALYERTDAKFWNDPYIASQMLLAHLDPGTDAASRKLEFIERCADFVAGLLPEGASVLDIGCGPGLYTKRFAERGLRVTGLDFSEGSIAYAKRNDPGSEYITGDYLTMDFNGKFDMVMLIYCDYGALIPEERRELLPRVYNALKPGGLFLLDVFTAAKARGGGNSWGVYPNGGFWSGEPYVHLESNLFFGDTAEVSRNVIIRDTDLRCYNIWNCYFSPQSLADEVKPFGFTVKGFYGDAAGIAYADGSEVLGTVLEKER